ncbi:mitotic checkpoint serine/threonine-protein kinase BUB1 beta isoform X9 [Silurus meridionalis]|nr:mitotic checkpoint serine/threonine-protein kinase BUB1 beta isoform X9 [Silurus meridionalis]
MEKWEFTTQQTNTCPLNPVENGIPSSWSRTQEERVSQTKEQLGSERSMYCKELVFVGETEFSFEELRTQRYYKRLNEKVLHLSKVKEELKCQVEQKQKLLHKSDAIQHQELQEDHMDMRDVPLLAMRLLEMVKRMHSCRLVHGVLKPETLMVCHSCEDSVISMDFSNSLDLELQTDVKTVQSFPSAQDYIKQGLLLPSASPYQVDLCGIAEIVHLLLFGKNMKIIKEESYWKLGEDCGPLDWQSALGLSNQLRSLWQDFFHNLLNPEDDSTELILSNLINNFKNALYEGLECPLSL